MSSGIASLPRDPDILIETIVGLRAENEKLRAMLETLKRALCGARSERRDADEAPLALGLGDLSARPVEPEPDAAAGREPALPKPVRSKAARNIGDLPAHLPREDVVIEPASDICPCCQGKLHRIGEDVSEMLDIAQAIIRVKCIRRRNTAAAPVKAAFVQAPAPPAPDGGLPTAALLAHIAVAKFAWHLPFHRQTQMTGRSGRPSRWFDAGALASSRCRRQPMRLPQPSLSHGTSGGLVVEHRRACKATIIGHT